MFIRKITLFLLIVVFTISAAGCATIINGTSQKIPVSSEPDKATVQVDGKAVYTTPVKLRLERRRDHELIFTKEGYQQQKVTVLHVLSEAVCGNILLGGVIGWGIDALNGCQYKLKPDRIHVKLEK